MTPDDTQKDMELSLPPDKPVVLASRYFLLVLFCFAQFLDGFYNSALFLPVPALKEHFGMSETDVAWLFSSYSLTFSSFLLISGRISDVYNPKIAFTIGLSGIGVASIISGFLHSKIGLLVIRAITGVFAALTVPSALRLLIHVFPNPHEQARAIGVFSATSGISSVVGLVIGGIIVQWASWRWVFWAAAILAFPLAGICIVSIPAVGVSEKRADRFKSLDLPGITILTSALILFIFAISSSESHGWASAMVLAPLLISLALAVAFFYWESVVPENRAAIPPKTWKYNNFGVLLSVGLIPFFWWTILFVMFTGLWQQVYGWSALSTALRIVPIGVTAFISSFTSSLAKHIESKWLILPGLGFTVIANILLVFADGPDKYWPFVFPAFVIGTFGMMVAFTHTNIAIFRSTPPAAAGIVGACINSALQLGSAVGLSISTTIEASIEKH